MRRGMRISIHGRETIKDTISNTDNYSDKRCQYRKACCWRPWESMEYDSCLDWRGNLGLAAEVAIAVIPLLYRCRIYQDLHLYDESPRFLVWELLDSHHCRQGTSYHIQFINHGDDSSEPVTAASPRDSSFAGYYSLTLAGLGTAWVHGYKYQPPPAQLSSSLSLFPSSSECKGFTFPVKVRLRQRFC